MSLKEELESLVRLGASEAEVFRYAMKAVPPGTRVVCPWCESRGVVPGMPQGYNAPVRGCAPCLRFGFFTTYVLERPEGVWVGIAPGPAGSRYAGVRGMQFFELPSTPAEKP